jgi:MOSC domain-containing protein YiiM
MNSNPSSAPAGHVASLHLHPHQPGAPLRAVETIEVIADKGVVDDPRYFGRVKQETGEPNPRQVTLIEREQMAEHAAALGLKSLVPGAVRANIETHGINLVSMVGSEIRIGEAVLALYAPRDPCAKMDAVCQGLRQLMMNHRQGVLARVVQSGKIRVGDTILARDMRNPRPAPVQSHHLG